MSLPLIITERLSGSMHYTMQALVAPTTVLTGKANGVGYITLNRPEKHNALNTQLRKEVAHCLQEFDEDEEVRCIVIRGAGKAFAAGADIKEMHGLTHADVIAKKFFSEWDDFNKIKKVTIAGVQGYAFGGGFELVMLCDISIASNNAVFALPEITIGTHPGLGGTQRLTKVVGKSKAMEWVLTGQHIDSHVALKEGLVSRVVPDDDLIEEVDVLAQKIASLSLQNVQSIKRCINYACEPSTQQLANERESFYSTFALKDRFEGMDAFLNKRKPRWEHE